MSTGANVTSTASSTAIGTPPPRLEAPALFPTTVVGSMPRPLFLKELFDEFHEGGVDDAERERLLDEAVPLTTGDPLDVLPVSS